MTPAWLEHVPCQAYLFEVRGDQFVLTAVSAHALRVHPELQKAIGAPMNALYRDQPQVLEDAHRAVTSRTTISRETPVRRYDRLMTTQVMVLTYVPLEGELVVYAHEVAPESSTQRALEESENRYRTLVDAMPVGVLLRDETGLVVSANDVAARLIGASSPAELIGKGWNIDPTREVLREDGTVLTRPALELLARDPQAHIDVLGLPAGGGQVQWVRRGSVPLKDANGTLRGFIVTLVDFNDRVAAERHLRVSAEKLRQAMGAARMGSWEYDLDLDQGMWSSQAVELFKLKGGLRSREQYREQVHPDDVAASAAAQRDLLSGATDVVEHEMRIIGGDGVTRWARVTGRALALDGHRKLVGTVMDVTRQHKLEEDVLRASRLESIGRLAGGIAHDFNNLLAAILGAVELLARDLRPDQQEDLDAIRHATTRAAELTRQLLAFARRTPSALAAVGLGALVRQSEGMLRRLVGASIKLEVTLDDWLVVQADAAQLEQVLVNLVINARDAMPNGGRLEIEVSRLEARESELPNGDWACLAVKDSGQGMSAETRAHIFDPFFTTKVHGTGLGLASSYGIVQQHGGHVVVQSELGKGSTFRVLLPRREERAAPTAAKGAAPVAARHGRVLVVDDDALVRRSTQRMLTSLGYQVSAAATGREASQLLRDEPIDLMVCDVELAGESGLDVVRAARALRPQLRVVLVSGLPEPAAEALPHPVLFLQKPFTTEGLDAALAAARPGTEP
ncbi:MAG: ATP-binding protein [Myxococcaceae bacterium]